MNGPKRSSKLRTLLPLLLLSLPLTATAQEHTPQQPVSRWLMLAEEQFENGFYALSSQSAHEYLNHTSIAAINTPERQRLEKAGYYIAVAGLKTDGANSADTGVEAFARMNNPVYRDKLALALGQYYFRHNDLANAIPWYERAGIANLSNAEIIDAKFELAYCYFNSNMLDKAEQSFATIKELPEGKYYKAGNYYYGLLAYNKSQYPEALKSFQRIDNEPEYRSIVPYYIAEIHYFSGDRKKALEEALRLMQRKDKLYYDNELHLLAAQCYFEAEKYREAVPYFEYYYEHTDKIRKEELYEMAYSYYQLADYKKAVTGFKPLSNIQDSLGQTAMYLLGDSYLKTGDKQSARTAFGICSNQDFNKSQQEAALLLYSKLSYELGYSDVAMRSLDKLLELYPNTGFKDEAYLLQSQLFAATNDYARAFAVLQKTGNTKDPNFAPAIQRAAYGYAIQQMLRQRYEQADTLLTIALIYGKQQDYVAATNFWKGDIAYRQQRFADAINYNQDYLAIAAKTTSLSTQQTPAHAYLNMGYAAMQQKDFAAAGQYFAKAQTSGGSTGNLAANAALREGDAAFMQKDFSRAAALYSKAAAGTGSDAEYARLQHAILLGLQGKNGEKAALLQGLVNSNSVYANDARYELALVQLDGGKYDDAVATLAPLRSNANARQLAPKAWLKTGVAYQQANKDDNAIDAFRHVVKEYPSAPETGDALQALKSLYIEHNEPEKYAQLLSDNNLHPADGNELDSAFYSAAEAQFADAKWSAAQAGFERYLKQYPNGLFATKAHYYEAESYYQQQQWQPALTAYEAVLATPYSNFTEASARRAADIAFADSNYVKSAQYYAALRSNALAKENLQAAYAGMMRSAAYTGQDSVAALYADTLLSMPELNEQLTAEARLAQATRLRNSGKAADANALYQQLTTAKNGAIATEARYYTAVALYNDNQTKAAETAANKNIKLSQGYDYWIVKNYLLLADVLVKENDLFNAKATLQSVIDHTGNAALKAEAQQKLDAVKAGEPQQSKLSE